MNVHSRVAPQRRTLKLASLVAVAVLSAATTTAAYAQKTFTSPEAAMKAFGDAVVKDREDALRTIFGDDFRKLIPPAGAAVRDTFVAEWAKSHTIEPVEAGHTHIVVGDSGWTFPVPLVKTGQGWRFDTRAGAEEMRLRRIGRNELAVIQTMLAIYDAQREYAQTAHDGEGVLAYASRMVSSSGKHDGLYWPTGPGEPASPLGDAFVDASSRNAKNAGYYGYHYKLLDSQGPHAPGGAYGYVVHGKLFGGFAVIAWPVKYGETGIKSFMVSHAGQVYQRDLGPDSAAKAEATKSFDPGPGWSKVPDADVQ
ncbi:DUF2950 domain-containing protein [Paraburkholderia phymatum]|uniref:DUF2950 domain-containing protein n=1 Tax=Paraburkholderia phymatum (strain DSM 17167 / CIP 108236 / LMG 21445 / STM815) TaxID=391038 RepID=B2JVH2_PARP8|nr:DUF2950 domain-containing protein [Paraburkholderia phymatum]ACC74949.1 conserved hypothetical protein [Paraburkholderia phymatum STM815]